MANMSFLGRLFGLLGRKEGGSLFRFCGLIDGEHSQRLSRFQIRNLHGSDGKEVFIH